jgi:large subunit ribosomal protein L29
MKENADKARALDTAEIQKQLREGAEQAFRLRFQISMGQMEGVKKVRQIRKDRARMLTVLRERELHPEDAAKEAAIAKAKTSSKSKSSKTAKASKSARPAAKVAKPVKAPAIGKKPAAPKTIGKGSRKKGGNTGMSRTSANRGK